MRLTRLGDSVSCVLSGVALRRFLALAVSIGSLPENLVLAPRLHISTATGRRHLSSSSSNQTQSHLICQNFKQQKSGQKILC